MPTEAFMPLTVPDDFDAQRYGLMSVITWVPSGDNHWKAGVQYDVDCAEAQITLSDCIVTGIAPKAATFTRVTRGARAFTVYAEKDCSPPGSDDWWTDASNEVITALGQASPTQIEKAFWSGYSGGNAAPVYPNLMSTGPVFDSTNDILLQPSATLISGSPLDVVEGLGRLEESLGNCYDGVGVIHIPVRILAELAAQSLVYRDGQVLRTFKGNLVAAGAGYDSTIGPGGTTPPAGSAWMFATSPIFGLRSAAQTRNNTVESFDRSVNTLKIIAEQTVLIGWKCCRIGVLVSTAGEPIGTPGA